MIIIGWLFMFMRNHRIMNPSEKFDLLSSYDIQALYSDKAINDEMKNLHLRNIKNNVMQKKVCYRRNYPH